MTQNNEKKKITVCHLSSVHPWFDTRIFYKQCKSLEEAGYNVKLIARKEDGKRETMEGIDVIPFPIYRNRFKRILLSPFKMEGMARKQKARIYQFHDPELIPVGVMLKLMGKKVIYDAHEDYSKQLLYKPWLKSSLLKRLIAFTFRIIEKSSILFFNRILAATPDIGEAFPAKKTVLVRNVPILSLIGNSVVPERGDANVKHIIYAGALARARGTKEIIEAVALLDRPVKLWLLGKWESAALEQTCRNLEGWKHVEYLGFKTPAEVYGYMKAADIGLALLYPIKNYLTSLPVKAFEYMASGVPMIMSDFPFWQETFSNCALFSDPKDVKKIADAINRFLNDEAFARQTAKKAKELVNRHYSWDVEKDNLLNIYREME